MVSPGDTLQWSAATPSESFAVRWQQGLCQKGTPIRFPLPTENRRNASLHHRIFNRRTRRLNTPTRLRAAERGKRRRRERAAALHPRSMWSQSDQKGAMCV
jgi:hypothetical protein